jgi:hypothetical protein
MLPLYSIYKHSIYKLLRLHWHPRGAVVTALATRLAMAYYYYHPKTYVLVESDSQQYGFYASMHEKCGWGIRRLLEGYSSILVIIL